jgi:hypothetical protein
MYAVHCTGIHLILDEIYGLYKGYEIIKGIIIRIIINKSLQQTLKINFLG